jgi:hypothetical protein
MEQKPPTKFDHLINTVEEYFKTRQELSKLIAIQKTSAVAGGLFSSIVIFLLFFFVIVFASISLAYFISMYTGKPYLGFTVITLLYLIAGIIAYAKRKALLEKPVMNAMIKNFFKEENHE